jgi:hypothetical protein
MNQPYQRLRQWRAADARRAAPGRSHAARGGVATGSTAVADAHRGAGKPVAYSTLFQ